MSLFGDILDANQIEEACLEHAKEWGATYLDEVAQQRDHPKGRGAYRAPRTHTTVNDFDKWPEDKLPCLLLISPGTVEQPVRRGGGAYSGAWYIAVAIIVSARNQESTRRLAMRYGAAYRALFLQRADFDGRLGGRMSVREWVSEDYDDLPMEEERNLAVAKLIFTVNVDGVTNAFAGPGDDDPRPGSPTPDYGELPTADNLSVGVIAGSTDTTLVPDVVTVDDEEA